jgi:exonuclease III
VDNTGFKLWYTGTTSKINGVRVLIDKSLKDGVVEVRRQGDRIILVKLVVSDMVLNVISAYASQIGHDESAKRQSGKTWMAWLEWYLVARSSSYEGTLMAM